MYIYIYDAVKNTNLQRQRFTNLRSGVYFRTVMFNSVSKVTATVVLREELYAECVCQELEQWVNEWVRGFV